MDFQHSLLFLCLLTASSSRFSCRLTLALKASFLPHHRNTYFPCAEGDLGTISRLMGTGICLAESLWTSDSPGNPRRQLSKGTQYLAGWTEPEESWQGCPVTTHLFESCHSSLPACMLGEKWQDLSTSVWVHRLLEDQLVLSEYKTRYYAACLLPQGQEGDGRTIWIYLQGLLAPICSHKQQGSSIRRSLRNKHTAFAFSRFQAHPHSLSKHLTSFQVSCYKGKCKQRMFQGVLSVSPQSVCSPRHFFSCLIYFILKGLSVCITRTGWERVSDVCRVAFLLLFVIVRIMVFWQAILLTHPLLPSRSLLTSSAGISTSLSELHVLEAFSLETYSGRLWQTLFYYPSNISLFTIWWLGNRTILLSNKINVAATWQNIQHCRGFALANACCILRDSLGRDTMAALHGSLLGCFIVPAVLLFCVSILIIAFSCHLGQVSLLLFAVLAYRYNCSTILYY